MTSEEIDHAVRAERARIVARLRELAETDDPTQPWQSKRERARFLLGCATLIEEEGRRA